FRPWQFVVASPVASDPPRVNKDAEVVSAGRGGPRMERGPAVVIPLGLGMPVLVDALESRVDRLGDDGRDLEAVDRGRDRHEHQRDEEHQEDRLEHPLPAFVRKLRLSPGHGHKGNPILSSGWAAATQIAATAIGTPKGIVSFRSIWSVSTS